MTSSAARSEATELAVLQPQEASLVPSAPRPEEVFRTALVNRLRASRAHPVVTVCAPAGYGKTALLAQWSSRDDRPFAFVSIAEDDPVRLCLDIGAAMRGTGLIPGPIVEALASRRRSVASARRLLVRALGNATRPFVLVLDDVHVLRSRDCRDTLAALAERVPDGATLALAGRGLPRLPIARMRVGGRLLEIGTSELALSRREADTLLRGLGIEREGGTLARLAEFAEGWVTGLYLAALALKENGVVEPSATGPAGADRFLVDYFDFEHLARLSAADLRFLTRTSVLDSMCGSLCDAVLGSEGSARKLRSLERAGQFVVPLDRSDHWYRYHHQFRQVLRTELERREPTIVPTLNRRAAAWCEANGAPEDAVSYAQASRDVDLLAQLAAPRILQAWSAGHDTAVETWLGGFDAESELARYPAIAVLGAWVHAFRGRPAEAERWLDVAVRSPVAAAPPDGSDSIQPWIAVARAAMCREGPETMRLDADRALRGLGPASRWRPAALLLRGAAQVLQAEDDRAEASLADAAEAAESVGATPSRIAALAQRSLLVAARGDETAGESLAAEARALVDEHGLAGYLRSAIAFAASARFALRAADFDHARADLEEARGLRGQLTHALPWLSVQTSLEAARVALALGDLGEADAWLSHADEIVRRRPRLGVLPDRLNELRAEVDRMAKGRQAQASALTAAELRLLPLLVTHLSFREIGERLHVSRNTVKTQAISVYRKLGVTSRSEAVESAAELGLLDVPRGLDADFMRTG